MGRRIVTAAGLLLTLLLALSAVVVVRAVMLESRQIEVEPVAVAVDVDAAVGRLAEALRIPTVSHPQLMEAEAFLAFHALLGESFPRVHAGMDRRVVNDLTLHLVWEGSDPEAGHVVMLAHQDVVPAEQEGWTHPPFSGAVADGFIWGRGALDNKSAVMGMLEAAEALLADGLQPRRTVHFVFGHDEEIGGHRGAAEVARRLAADGTEVAAVFDEGMAIVRDIVPGVPGPVALVGIAEKGSVAVELTAHAEGGHAALPPDDLAVLRLARAIDRLHHSPMPVRIDGATAAMFEHTAPEMAFRHRLLFANRWLFDPLIQRRMAAQPATRATLGTTVAPTMLRAGDRPNVLPRHATATVSARVHPRDSTSDVLAHLQQALGGAVAVEPLGDVRWEPSPSADLHAMGFEALRRAAGEVFPGVPVAPALVLGATDARHFTGLTPNIYRFMPVTLGPEDLARIHGGDERIAIDAYADLIRFYQRLLRHAGGIPQTPPD